MEHILVIDDDPALLGVVSAVLTDEGYQVATAANGREGLAQVADDLPSLILLDMRMPVMDGWEFARSLRASGHAGPILVMTAASDAKQWAAEINADGYLSKPFDIDALLDAVARLRVDPPTAS